MSKFIIEIKLADGNTKQVKVYVDNRTAELLNQCDARVLFLIIGFTIISKKCLFLPRKYQRNSSYDIVRYRLKKRKNFFCVYFRVILCYHSNNRKVNWRYFSIDLFIILLPRLHPRLLNLQYFSKQIYNRLIFLRKIAIIKYQNVTKGE